MGFKADLASDLLRTHGGMCSPVGTSVPDLRVTGMPVQIPGMIGGPEPRALPMIAEMGVTIFGEFLPPTPTPAPGPRYPQLPLLVLVPVLKCEAWITGLLLWIR